MPVAGGPTTSVYDLPAESKTDRTTFPAAPRGLPSSLLPHEFSIPFPTNNSLTHSGPTAMSDSASCARLSATSLGTNSASVLGLSTLLPVSNSAVLRSPSVLKSQLGVSESNAPVVKLKSKRSLALLTGIALDGTAISRRPLFVSAKGPETRIGRSVNVATSRMTCCHSLSYSSQLGPFAVIVFSVASPPHLRHSANTFSGVTTSSGTCDRGSRITVASSPTVPSSKFRSSTARVRVSLLLVTSRSPRSGASDKASCQRPAPSPGTTCFAPESTDPSSGISGSRTSPHAVMQICFSGFSVVLLSSVHPGQGHLSSGLLINLHPLLTIF